MNHQQNKKQSKHQFIDRQQSLNTSSHIDLEMGQIRNQSIYVQDAINTNKYIGGNSDVGEEKSTEEWEELLKEKMKKRNAQKIQKAAIQKYFGHFSYLPRQNLKKIQSEVERYVQQNKKGKSGIQLVRFSLRKNLIKICLIAIAQFINKHIPATNKMQQVYLRPESDKLGMTTIIVHSLQSLLFQQLYQQNTKTREQPYQNKMKMLFQHLYDQVNFKLRRDFINKTLTPKFILNATQEDILSEEVKERNKLELRKLIQESQDLQVVLQEEYKRKEMENQKYKKNIADEMAEPVVHQCSDMVEMEQQMETSDAGEMGNSRIEEIGVEEYEEAVKKVRWRMDSCRQRMGERLEKLPDTVGRKLKIDFKKVMKVK